MQIFATRLFDGHKWHKDTLLCVNKDKIESISSGHRPEPHFKKAEIVAPGFIDIQVNGGGGVLFNHSPSVHAIKQMSKAHQQFGTTAMLPTVITDSLNTMQQTADAMAQAIESCVPGVLGIHFEGPHLSSAKKGIHPQQEIRPITEDEMAVFLRKDLGVVCVTLAPEQVDTAVIKRLVEHGVIVCLGHSNANADQVMAALDAGARGFTHLYNAMSPLHSRAAGMVGAALLRDDAYAGLIVDLEHVDKYACQLAIKAKGAKRIMLVTDAMSHVGAQDEVLVFNNEPIYRQGNRLSLENGTLAGSALDMASAVRNTHTNIGMPLEQALAMATSTPAHFLRLEQHKGQLSDGADADFVMMDEACIVQKTFIAGHCVFDLQTKA